MIILFLLKISYCEILIIPLFNTNNIGNLRKKIFRRRIILKIQASKIENLIKLSFWQIFFFGEI